jgi:nucleoside-diphosphate-sugar epimerase
VAEAIVRALEKEGNEGEKYLVGKHALEMGELTRMVCEISGAPLPKLSIPRSGGDGGSHAFDKGGRPDR